LYTGYLYQDIDKIESLERLTKSINSEPLFPSGILPVNGNLQEGLAGVTVIGDSVCLGARKKLMESIPNCIVDAEGNRQMWQGHRLLMQLQNNGSLREYIVVALGTNQNENSLRFIDRIIEDIKPGHRLIFVTPFNGAMTRTWNTYKIIEYQRTLPAKYPFITIADWAALIEGQTQLLASDKIHIGGLTVAISLYTNLVIDAINVSAKKPVKQ